MSDTPPRKKPHNGPAKAAILPGRPTLYTQDLADAICGRLAAGESLRSVCRDEGMPAETRVREWAIRDRDGFSAQYARAREAGMDAMADELLEIADDGRNDWMDRARTDGTIERVIDHEHVTRSRLRADCRKWLMSKIAPKRYGDRLMHAGDPESPLKLLAVDCPPPETREEWLARTQRERAAGSVAPATSPNL